MIAETTAPARNNKPNGSTTNSICLFTRIKMTPINEISIPAKLYHVIRSLRTNQPATGVKTGIVAMITEVIVGVENFNP
jgi:hypothetical protein